MTKTTKKISITAILIIFGTIVLVILTWPRLSLQTKFDGGQSNFQIYNPDTAKLTVSVWNRGGAISDWKIITPESCVSAKVGGNITCTHEGFGGITPCTFDIMSFKFNEPYPKNFTFTLDVQSSFSFIPIATMNETYYCNLNGDNVDSYNCSKI